MYLSLRSICNYIYIYIYHVSIFEIHLFANRTRSLGSKVKFSVAGAMTSLSFSRWSTNWTPNHCIIFGTSCVCLLTHLPLDKMTTISQTTFWNAFSWMKRFVFWYEFHWSLFLRVRLTIFQIMVQIMAWCRTKPTPILHCSASLPLIQLTFPHEQNGRHFADDIFKCIFLNKNIVFWFKFHWSLFYWSSW